MSFLNINDLEERDAMIEDYLALIKRIKDRNLEERGNLMDRQCELEETFEPVLTSNEEIARDIIKDLEPITKGLHELNRNLEMKKPPRLAGMRKGESKYGLLAVRFYRNYLNPNCQVYKTVYAMKMENPWLETKLIDMVGDNIVIDDEVYIGTPGLWSHDHGQNTSRIQWKRLWAA